MSMEGTVSSNLLLRGKITAIPSVDVTLSKEGECAEAKATGDALYAVEQLALNVQNTAYAHASRHSKVGEDRIYPSDIGALASTGGTVTGQIFSDSSNVNGFLKNRTVESVNAQCGFGIANYAKSPAVSFDLTNKDTGEVLGQIMCNKANGLLIYGSDGKYKKLFGEHNKPTGSYTGSGSDTKRTVTTGGVGNVLVIWRAGLNFMNIVTPSGAFSRNASSFVYYTPDEAKFENGVLTLAVAATAINSSGDTYNYQVL